MGDDRLSVEELFHRASELAPDRRAAFLAENCLDPARRDEVLALLANADAGSLLDRPPVRLAGPTPLTDPTSIGPYRILERLGEGGFGVVYVAEQTEPVRRRVALKLIKAGMDTEKVLARFEAERQALALMDHPNIARVLDAGATDVGRPYFVMELVRGEPITHYCDRHRLTLRERLNLFVDVCVAVQHAHQKGVVHRDVKPSNVLIALLDGHPVPKVIDFGIAKATATPLTERTLHTGLGELVGTPDYMSPEQADPVGIAPDTTTDVYSLGVLLYELLTGVLPFHEHELGSQTADHVHRILSEVDPPRPSARFGQADQETLRRAQERGMDPYGLARSTRGDLDWIVTQAMDKDRTRRYQTALELAREVRRYLDDEPVLAGPPRRWTRLKKFVRRHRVAFGATAVVTLGLLVAAGAVTYALFDSRRQQERTRLAYAESEAVTGFLTSMLSSADPLQEGRDVTVRQILDRESAVLSQRFRGRPLLAARLHTTIGSTYRELGELDAAEDHLEQGLELRSERLPADHELVVQSKYELAVLDRHAGRYEEARRRLAELLPIQEARVGPDHQTTIDMRYELGSSYVLTEEHTEALPILQTTMASAERSLGTQHPTTAAIASTLGLAYLGVGKMEEAERYLQRALDVDRANHGHEDLRVIPAAQNLAGLYRQMGRYEEALPLYELGARISEASLGEDHPSTQRYRNNLALCYSDMGRYQDAEPLSVAVVEHRRRELGDNHPSTLASRLNLSLLYRRLGRFVESEVEARAVLAASVETLDADHLYRFVAHNGLGVALVGQRRYREALSYIERAVQDGLRTLGQEHWRLGDALANRGTAHRGLGNTERAEADLLEGIRILDASLGPEHPSTRSAVASLVALYEELGREEDRTRWLARL